MAQDAAGLDVGRSWLKVALRCSMSSWTADGGRARAVCTASALAYRGEAMCIVYDTSEAMCIVYDARIRYDAYSYRIRASYCPTWVDGYLPPKVATTTTHVQRGTKSATTFALAALSPRAAGQVRRDERPVGHSFLPVFLPGFLPEVRDLLETQRL
eukprot:scaffold125533_cov48-Phaeocystis_antarctica.AAC.1